MGVFCKHVNSSPEICREAGPELISRSLTDDTALGKLYQIYYDRIFQYAVRRLLNIVDAEDITSATFLKMIENLPRYETRGYPFSAWLYRIMNNEIIDMFRKRNCSPVCISNLDTAGQELMEYVIGNSASQENTLIHLEQCSKLHKAIMQIPLKQQNVITLRYFEEFSIREIAYITNSRAGTVKWRIHSALKKLTKLLQD